MSVEMMKIISMVMLVLFAIFLVFIPIIGFLLALLINHFRGDGNTPKLT